MANSILENFEDFFQKQGLQVPAGELQGTVQVVNRDSLVEMFRNAITEAEDAAKRSAAEGSGVSKMLDDYMRQAADLRMKEQSVRRTLQETEFELKEARDRIQELESQGGGEAGAGSIPISRMESFLTVDVSEGESFFEETNESLTVLESALDQVGNSEGSLDIAARVAELRSDFNSLQDDYRKACSDFLNLASILQTGTGDAAQCMDLVEAVTSVRGSVAEVHLIKKSVDFLSAVLNVE
ncbi:MAG: hypothetical protein ACYTHM_07880 [Planctomycetota bacterium]|jgi:hypothetical protein